MKRNQNAKILFIFLALLPVAFSACIKDKCSRMRTYSWYVPVYKTKAEVRANIKSNAPKEILNTGKLYIYGNYIFLNDLDRGIHVIDNSNPSSPRKIAFIDIPGNVDIAVKDNILYADLYTDLVALDISQPQHVVVKKILENRFPNRYWGGGFIADENLVIVDWKRVDTTIKESCSDQMFGPLRDVAAGNIFFSTAGSASASTSPVGTGGSMARFTIMNNRLYTVSTSNLDVFNINDPTDPVHINTNAIGWNIETIYPFKNKLFIGSQTGMFIYDVSNPDVPAAAGQFQHIRSCDPVIANDEYAFVTLSSGSPCLGSTNQLEVLKLNNLSNPELLKIYAMTNPKGLSQSGNLLFICDGTAGLKVYDASQVMNLSLKKTIGNLDAYDVITMNNRALVVAKDGLYQYDFSNIDAMRLLSKISISK